MSIKKRTILLVFGTIIMPMFLFLIISNIIMFKLNDSSAAEYLKNGLRNAQSIISSRMDEMQSIADFLSLEERLQNAAYERNSSGIESELEDLNKVLNYVDMILFFDPKGSVLFSNKELKAPEMLLKKSYLERINMRKASIATMDRQHVDDIFYSDSTLYQESCVKVSSAEQNNRLYKNMLMGIVIAPVYGTNDQLLGYILFADIINNDPYFPEMYTNSISESFLSIGMDGIRVTSNIKSKESSNYIGSKNPVALEDSNALQDKSMGVEGNYTYGKVLIGTEIHYYLDSGIKNIDGDVVGELGVGIPKYKFNTVVNANNNLILIITCLFLFVLLFIGRYFANKITRPLKESMNYLKEITAGKRDITVKSEWLTKTEDEGIQLLQLIHELAVNLDLSEQKRLSYELELNKYKTELEEQVAIRTRDLQVAMFEAKRGDDVKSQFLANMSHELKTPLNSIISSSLTLENGVFGPLNEKQIKYLQVISNNAGHLLKLINDILDISKIESGKMYLMKNEFLAQELIGACIFDVAGLASNKNIQIRLQVEPEQMRLYVDGNKFRQIILNLLLNAIKFSYNNGEIHINCIENPSYHSVTVRDFGIGIDEQDHDRIFEPFEQVDGSYSRQYDGTGLGLPIVKRMVELHQGAVSLKSSLGEGAEFTIFIPKKNNVNLK